MGLDILRGEAATILTNETVGKRYWLLTKMKFLLFKSINLGRTGSSLRLFVNNWYKGRANQTFLNEQFVLAVGCLGHVRFAELINLSRYSLIQ